MATLPAINKSNQSNPRSKSTRKNIKFMTWRELELVKQQAIRDENPKMNRLEVSTYRNSYKHNLCIFLLKSGFHKSFEELFSLIERRRSEKLEAGIDSALWQETSLDEQEDKLNEMWKYLINAESAIRIGKWEDVYEARNHLAEYFLGTGDIWLSDYFFKSALETSLEVRLDGRRREAEANCNMGLACERKGDIKEATNHMEKFYKLSLGRVWLNNSGISHGLQACRHLSRLFTSLAEEVQTPKSAQEFFHRALSMAKEGEDTMQIANAALKLGRNYEQLRDSEAAIQYLMECLETAQSVRDDETVGHACEALARSYLTQGNLPRALEFLDHYAKTSRSNEFTMEFIEACNCMGKIYNTTGVYDKAVEHFEAAYEQSDSIMHDDEASKVQLGVAKGNLILNAFKKNMELPNRFMMSRIVTWKDERKNEFNDPLPTSPPPQLTPHAPPDPTQPFREVDEVNDAKTTDDVTAS